MQFTTLALSALSIGSALAQDMVTVHVVKVGNANGSLTFSPNDMTAKAGEMVQFQFAPNNHTVTQSTFDQPCQPISKNSNVTGIFSGFMPVSASSTTTPTYTIMINNTNPLWLYCSQGKHCQNGMSMVINAPAANKSRTLASYQELAKSASANLPGSSVSNGTASSIPGSPTDTSSSTSTSTSGAASSTNSSAATVLRVGEAMGLGGVLAVFIAFVL